jgi:hypothetical protein
VTDLDRVHERVQALIHGGGDATRADRAGAAPEFSLGEAQDLIDYGPESARIHIASSRGDAMRAAQQRTSVGGRGPTDRPPSHSVIPSGAGAMASQLRRVLNQFRLTIRALRVGEESPPLTWTTAGAGSLFLSTGGQPAEEQPWTQLEVIVIRTARGFLLKHCQPK